MNQYPHSWVHPDKKPDLHYDDWHQGFSHSHAQLYPQHPHNQAYMMGWLHFERIYHTPSQPDIRKIGGQINHGN